MQSTQTIERFAEEHNLKIGQVLFLIVKYLCDDPRVASRGLQNTLSDVDAEELEEAFEAIAEDMERR